MPLSRRDVLIATPCALGLAACGGPSGSGLQLSNLIDAPVGSHAPGAGFVIMRGDELLASDAAGVAQTAPDARPFTIETPFRAASVSKLIVALCAQALDERGVIGLDDPIDKFIPEFPTLPYAEPGQVPSLRQLLAHTSGLSDPDAYWVEHPGDIRSLFDVDLTAASHAPGYFEYCNFGYGIVATALELATGSRFDVLAQELVLTPMGLDAGFNWSGVSAEKRQRGATLYRESARGWDVQIDGADSLASSQPAVLMASDSHLDTYTAGQNGTLFSPQGGLRANLIDLAKIAWRLKTAPALTQPVWELNGRANNGEHDKRYFTAFGTGVHLYPSGSSFWPGQQLYGHHGEAYGLYAGAWYAPDLDIAFSYVATGSPDVPPRRSDQHPALNTFTQLLMTVVREAYAKSPAAR